MKRKCHILVVDDEPHVLVTYQLILQQQGYEVSAALSAEEARQMLLERKIDLLLCDLSLEKRENGFEVIEFARQKESGDAGGIVDRLCDAGCQRSRRRKRNSSFVQTD